MNSLIEQTTAHFDGTMYKSALKTGLFDYQNARSWYRDVTGGDMHRDLVLRFIETQALILAPIAPHWSEYIWRDVLKKVRRLLSSHLRQDGTVQDAKFPTPSCPEDTVIGASQTYIKSLSDAVHQAEGLQMKKKAKGKQSTFDPRKPKRLWIYVATEFPAWQQKYIDALQGSYDDVPTFYGLQTNLEIKHRGRSRSQAESRQSRDRSRSQAGNGFRSRNETKPHVTRSRDTNVICS
jgi:leucyl-tRNA synthetase